MFASIYKNANAWTPMTYSSTRKEGEEERKKENTKVQTKQKTFTYLDLARKNQLQYGNSHEGKMQTEPYLTHSKNKREHGKK